MAPRSPPKSFPCVYMPDHSKITKALDAARPFLNAADDEAAEQIRTRLKMEILRADSFFWRVPLGKVAYRKSIERAQAAFRELHDALEGLEMVVKGTFNLLEKHLSQERKDGLAAAGVELNYWHFTHRFDREGPAWIDALEILKRMPQQIPGNYQKPNSLKHRDELVTGLREIFADHGKVRRSVNRKEQERRFIESVLRELDMPTPMEPARSARTLRARSRANKTK